MVLSLLCAFGCFSPCGNVPGCGNKTYKVQIFILIHFYPNEF
uniref:Uncharacterized protein n=1 Tax=Rhizophora mucronata TaxID=61149 RepID=A0A2P2N4P7_RHIMU